MALTMNRYWFLSFTTYGSRLPGDRRGFVSNVADASGNVVRHNQVWQPFDEDHPGLRNHAAGQMAGRAILLILKQAEAMLAQFQETSIHRGWQLLAVGIMVDHVHIVVGVPGDPERIQYVRDQPNPLLIWVADGW